MTRTLQTDRNPFLHYGFELDDVVERCHDWRENYGDRNSQDFKDRPSQIWLGYSDTTRPSPIGVSDNRHLMTIAGSRAGKGTSAIVPNLCLYHGSVVCLDPKGENASLTAKQRRDGLGQDVFVLDPFYKTDGVDDMAASFNPLEFIDPDGIDAVDQAADIANALVVVSDDRNAHWDESARSFIKALILHVKSKDPNAIKRLLGSEHPLAATRRPSDLVLVRALLMGGAPFYASVATKIQQRRNSNAKQVEPFDGLLLSMSKSRAFNGVVAAAANALLTLGPNERGSILSTARRNTEFLDSPPMQECLSGQSSFNPRDLKENKKGTTVYLCLPSGRLHTHFRWMRVVLASILGALEHSLAEPATGHSTLFILDEFAQLNRMELVEKAAGLMAGYGVKLWIILQDITQLQRLYAESWETFFGNAGVVQFFGNTDLTTLDYLARKLGRMDTHKSRKADQREAGDSDLMRPAELEKLLCREEEIVSKFGQKYGLQIVLLSGQRPLLLRKTRYFEDVRFEGMFRKPRPAMIAPPAKPALLQGLS